MDDIPKTPIYQPRKESVRLKYQVRDERLIHHRPVDIACQRFTPENHVYSQDKVAQYEDHYTQHVQSQAEMFHVLGVVHQGVVRR